jgi:hypothetical protein
MVPFDSHVVCMEGIVKLKDYEAILLLRTTHSNAVRAAVLHTKQLSYFSLRLVLPIQWKTRPYCFRREEHQLLSP